MSAGERRTVCTVWALAVLAVCTSTVGADGPFERERWWLAWQFDATVLLSIASLAWFYWCGLTALWHKGGAGRVIARWQVGAFAAGLLVVLLALVSPVDALSQELASLHMIQHMLLMMIAAPLVVLGSPGLVMFWALPVDWRQSLRRGLGRVGAWSVFGYLLWQPALVWCLYALVLWLWHLPMLYQAALRNGLLHDLQHLTFFAAACLYWRVLLDPVRRSKPGGGIGVLYLFTTSLHTSVLGIFMVFSPWPWYADYADTAAFWKLTALEDQQLAGMIMWMPGCLIYAVVAAILFIVWLHKMGSEPGINVHQRIRGVPTRPSMAAPVKRLVSLTLIVLLAVSLVPQPPSSAALGVHGGTVVAVGREYHAEAIIQKDGILALYTLGRDQQVLDVPVQSLEAQVQAEGEQAATTVLLEALPQSGDAAEKTSRFCGKVPERLQGKTLAVTVPNLRFDRNRYRVRFVLIEDGVPRMPAGVAAAEEAELYLRPGGKYTLADIEANGTMTASQKFGGFRAQHDYNPKPGDPLCPITLTKAHPKCTWVIGGNRYQFCCPPCIDEFVAMAKENPQNIKGPEDYVKR